MCAVSDLTFSMDRAISNDLLGGQINHGLFRLLVQIRVSSSETIDPGWSTTSLVVYLEECVCRNEISVARIAMMITMKMKMKMKIKLGDS